MKNQHVANHNTHVLKLKHLLLVVPLFSCLFVALSPNVVNADYQPLRDMLPWYCDSIGANCSFPGFVDANDTNSSTISGTTINSAYAFRALGYTITTYTLGTRTTATCHAGSNCRYYYVTDSSGNVISEDRLSFAVASGSNAICSYWANGTGYGSCGKVTVAVKDSTLYNKTLGIHISRCADWGAFYCSIPSYFNISIKIVDSNTWTATPIINGPTSVCATNSIKWDYGITTSVPAGATRKTDIAWNLDKTGSWSGNVASGTLATTSSSLSSSWSYTTTVADVGKNLGMKFSINPTKMTNGAINTASSSTSSSANVLSNWKIAPLTATADKTCTLSGDAATGSSCSTLADSLASAPATIKWDYKATQAGPTATNTDVTFTVTHTNWSSDANLETKTSGWAAGSTASWSRSRTISQDDVGKTFCSKLNVSKSDDGSCAKSNPTSSSDACVYVPYKYTLTPTAISNSGDGYGSVSGNITWDEEVIFEGKIQNISGPTKSKTNIPWEVFVFAIPNTSGAEPSLIEKSTRSDTLNNTSIGSIYGISGVKNFSLLSASSTAAGFSPSPLATTVYTTANLSSHLNNLNLGDRFCFAIRIKEYSWVELSNQNPTTNYSYSKPACLIVSKSPQIQIRGADSKSGAKRFGQTELTGSQHEGGFEGSSSSNKNRGSWSQYGLLSGGSGKIISFGSTGYTLNGSATDNNKSQACKLLFANTTAGGSACTGTNNGQLGINDRIITIPKMAERNKADLDDLASKDDSIIDKTGTTSLSLTGLKSGTYYISNDVTITASTLGKDQHITLIVLSHNVNISGNIEVNSSDTYKSLETVPSLIVIAKNIYVNGLSGDSKIYGTYIAKERFNTCNLSTAFALAGAVSYNSSTGAGVCQNQLTITGAVISRDRPNLWRTYGADKGNEAVLPSEIFQYTPNLYLTPYTLGQTGNANNWQLTDVKQLPARM